jgi:hypothetical protein
MDSSNEDDRRVSTRWLREEVIGNETDLKFRMFAGDGAVTTGPMTLMVTVRA